MVIVVVSICSTNGEDGDAKAGNNRIPKTKPKEQPIESQQINVNATKVFDKQDPPDTKRPTQRCDQIRSDQINRPTMKHGKEGRNDFGTIDFHDREDDWTRQSSVQRAHFYIRQKCGITSSVTFRDRRDWRVFASSVKDDCNSSFHGTGGFRSAFATESTTYSS